MRLHIGDLNLLSPISKEIVYEEIAHSGFESLSRWCAKRLHIGDNLSREGMLRDCILGI